MAKYPSNIAQCWFPQYVNIDGMEDYRFRLALNRSIRDHVNEASEMINGYRKYPVNWRPYSSKIEPFRMGCRSLSEEGDSNDG